MTLRGVLSAAVIVLLAAGCAEQKPASAPAPASSPFDTADTLYRAARYEDAAKEYATLRDRFAQSGEQAKEWRARLWWVKSMHVLGRNKELAVELEPLRKMSAGDPIREAWTRCTFGLVNARTARFDEALADGEFGLNIARSRNDPSLASVCYDTLITTLSNTGRYRESLETSERRLAVERSRNAPPFELADALNDIGVDYRHTGRFEQAIAVYEESLALYRRVENPEGMAKVLFNLGNIYQAIGDVQRNVRLKRESLVHAEKMGHAFGLGMLHGDLGEVFLEAKNFIEARDHLESALAISGRANLPLVEVNALEYLGRLETAEAKYARSREVLARGIRIADEKSMQAYRSRIRSVAARNEAADRQPAEAIRLAEEALRIAIELDDPEIEFMALEARAIALEAAGDRQAGTAYLDAVELLESWRGRLALGDLRIGVAERRLGVYEGAIRLLLAQGRLDESWYVAERARARVLLALMAEQDARMGRRSAEAELRQRLREAYEARRSVRESLRPALDRQIAELTARLSRAEEAARSRNPLPTSAAEIRQALLLGGGSLLEFFWGDRDVYGWWIDRSGTRAVRLGSAESLGPLVDFTRLSVEKSEDAESWRVPASRAFRELVMPLGPDVGSRLFVVPDGPLAYLPLEVMIPPDSRLPWGAHAEFTYGPSAAVLVALARRGPARGYSRTLLAVGDPTARRFPMLAALVSAPRDDSAPLPFAVKEVRWISRLYESDTLLGSDATVSRWMGMNPERYRYLHFATHARVNDRQPMKTALRMAGGELDVQRIREMSLNAELVTLSACETALGPRIRGEGVIGLPHAFLSAGARGVIVTLWRVTDDSTAEFVRDFYGEIRRGSSPSTALRSVRRRWIQRAEPPSRWAPFIVVGANV